MPSPLPTISLDLETTSYVDLPTRGANVYFEDPRTDVLCAAYHIVGEASVPKLWVRPNPPPPDLVQAVQQGCRFSGWNVVQFDRLGWNQILMPRYGFPPISDDNWLDSMHLAAAANLPRSLDGCAEAVGAPFTKSLKDQTRLRRITNLEKTPIIKPDDLEWLHNRCVQDVIMEEDVLRRLPQWPSMAPWLKMPSIDRKINDRGILIDMPLVTGMSRAAKTETVRLNTLLEKTTSGRVESATKVEELKRWLIDCGVELPANVPIKPSTATEENPPHEDEEDLAEEAEAAKHGAGKSPWRLRKSDLADILARPNLPPACRQALLIRWELSKASVRKLNAIMARANADGYLRGGILLGGAQQTMRFSSTGVQVHNLLRDSFANPDEIADMYGLSVKKDKDRVHALAEKALHQAIEIGREGDADTIRTMYETQKKDAQGRPYTAGLMTWISRMIRPSIAAPARHLLLNGDFSSIEARITAWLAQEIPVLQAYYAGKDVYVAIAAGMFGIPEEQVTKLQRQSGKVTVLACSFGGGMNALIAMAYGYGMLLSLESANDNVKRFRTASPATVQYWYATDEAAANAVMYPGHEFPVPPCGFITYFMDKSGADCLCARLPSGRLLRYWQPRLTQNYWPDGRPMPRPSLSGLSVKGRAVFRRSLYHCVLVENSVQGIGADMLCTALNNLDQAGFNIQLHVHDSAAAPISDNLAESRLQIFRECMINQSSWTRGLPIDAQVDAAARFS